MSIDDVIVGAIVTIVVITGVILYFALRPEVKMIQHYENGEFGGYVDTEFENMEDCLASFILFMILMDLLLMLIKFFLKRALLNT